MKKLFVKCIKDNKIAKFLASKSLIEKELLASSSDLKDAQDSFMMKKYKWATIQAYYSMFHLARALLFSKGYREKSHICLIAAINVLFVETNLVPRKLIDNFLTAKELRENADYANDF